ncbi:glycosyltransferase [Pseudomonas rustica]|uniref:glycosyltransferase n=1 Tax=Pseudomonas rustica TaxID=2827099 RepID=UPI001BAFD57D|nr:glycosyltransferase [Pseudomonas rustica]
MEKLHWSVDSLVLRDHTYFGFGWAFHEDKTIVGIKLTVKTPEGHSQAISATYGNPRDDVASHFSGKQNSLHSGFVMYGSCKSDAESGDTLALLVQFDDGTAVELPVSVSSLISLEKNSPTANALPLLKQFWAFFKRGFALVKQLKFKLLFEKVRRYMGNRPSGALNNVEQARSQYGMSGAQSSVLIIDHDLGGGANHYRERLVDEKIREGKAVYIFSFHIATLSYVLMVRKGGTSETLSIPGYEFLVDLCKSLQINEIVYNTGVSFANSEVIPQLIIQLKKELNPKLLLLVHDFFMVCPSHFLIDSTDKYCGIPDLDKCQSCLVNNHNGFTSLFNARDMRQWRALWGTVLSLADEIRTFSNNTLDLLCKAYPSIDLSRTVVKPHVVEYIDFGSIKPSQTSELRVGVVGQIGFHKGAQIVQRLSEEILRQNLPIKIVIIGSIETQCDASVVSQTGHYKHDDLAKLIESSGVNVMLFPSIWPETFSYVVQELMEMKLPVASFDLGAPAERLASYQKGLILKDFDVPSVLDELVLFHQRIYSVQEYSK